MIDEAISTMLTCS